MGEILQKIAIKNSNLLEYLTKKYDVNSVQSVIKVNQIQNIKPLLQENYGGANDCTLTSITTILSYYLPNKPVEEIYNVVEKHGLKLFYTGEKGTNPIVMRTIMNLAAKDLGLKKSAVVRYGKNISYNYAGIKKHIDEGRPVMLSVYKDGRGFYDDHSTTIIGYGEYKIDKQRKARMLKIYDNWYDEVTYVDYDLIHMFSSLHYYN